MKIFLTCAFKLRAPTGRKARVLAEAHRLYAETVQAVLTDAKARLPELEALDKKARRGHRLEALLGCPEDAGRGLHSSLRAAAVANAAGAVGSYIALHERARKQAEDGRPTPLPAWPGDADNGWPDYLAILDDMATLADDLDQETELRNRLAMAAFAVKSERRQLGDVLWFPRMDGARHARNAALLTDGRNYWAMLYLLAPDHPLAEQISGDGHLREVGAAVWVGRSKCAIVCPLETDRHDWQQERFLRAAEEGQLSIQTAQLYRREDGDWYFAVQFAAERELVEPENWLGVAFDRDVPVLASQEGEVWRLTGEGLQRLALTAVLARASLQQRGKDISYHRPHGTAARVRVHQWANAIVEQARRLNAGIAVPATGAPRLGVPRAFLAQVLTYKAALAGLPVRLASVKGAAVACPGCGGVVPKADSWCCSACGLELPSVGSAVAWHLAKRAAEKARQRAVESIE